MKTSSRIGTQRGFFDLGISLIVLAIGGGAATVANTQHADEVAQTEQVQMSTQAQSRYNATAWDSGS